MLEIGTVRFGDPWRRYLNYCYQRCDISNLSEQDTSRIQNASALFLLLDDADKLDAVMDRLKEILAQFKSDKPAIVLFDALVPPEPLIHESAVILKDLDEEMIDLNKKIQDVMDTASVDIALIPITHHLEVVTRSVFRCLCEKWKPFLARSRTPNSKLMVKDDTPEEESYDPVEHALECIWRSLPVKEHPNSDAFEMKMTEAEEDQLMREWEHEWKVIKGYGQLMKVQHPDELYKLIETRDAIINLPDRPSQPTQSRSPQRQRTNRARSRSPSRRSRSRSRSLQRYNMDYA